MGSLTPQEILTKWGEYVEFDPEQTSFAMFSQNYEMHRIGKDVIFINEFDPTGNLAVIYLKQKMMDYWEHASIKAINLLRDKDCLREHYELYDMLASDTVTEIESNLLDCINTILTRGSIDSKRLGEIDRDALQEIMSQSFIDTVRGVKALNMHAYALDGRPLAISGGMSTSIIVADDLAQAIRGLEQAQDGIYVIYTKMAMSADGWFGIFIKSGDNIVSLDERIDEAYPGQHKMSRNGRYLDDKAYEIFPYNEIFDYSDYDYKGYARTYTLNEEGLSIFDLPNETLAPMLLAVFMVTNFADGMTPDLPIIYTQSMVFRDGITDTTTALAKVNESNTELAHHNMLDRIVSEMTTENVIAGNLAREIAQAKESDPNYRRSWLHTNFRTDESPYAQAYGDGFAIDTTHLLVPNKHLLFDRADRYHREAVPDNEFIGTEDSMRAIAYRELRQQYADHIERKMLEEYEAYGGIDIFMEYFMRSVNEHLEDLLKIAALHFSKSHIVDYAGNGKDFRVKLPNMDDEYGRWELSEYPDPKTYRYESKRGKYRKYFANKMRELDDRFDIACDPRYDAKPNIVFEVSLITGEQLERMLGMDALPTFAKLWHNENFGGRTYNGNHILNAVDPVFDIQNVLNDRSDAYLSGRPFYAEFKVAMCKRTLNKLLRENDLPQPDWRGTENAPM